MRLHVEYSLDMKQKDIKTPLQLNDARINAIVEPIVGKECDYSGAGFGTRDIGWWDVANDVAEAAAVALMDAGYNAVVVEDKNEEDDA